MKELLRKFETQDPEIIFQWNDSQTSAKGWAVINSLRGGAAGGGTRMRKGLNQNEVLSLAKTMEVKFTISGPQIGGAKSGIDFDPSDPRKNEVLKRWYKAVMPLLKNYYGTGGDLNVCEINDVIPVTESYGLWHPQEGVVTGHFAPTEPERIKKITHLRTGVSMVVEDQAYTPDTSRRYVVADLITGWGVAQSVRHYYDIYGGDLAGKRVIVQGWGNVGSAAAYYLASRGAVIVGIIDRNGGIIAPEGINGQKVKELYLNKQGNTLAAENMLSFEQINERIWDLEADIFLPCAASRLVQKDQVERLIAKGLKVIACGANVPFADPDIFYGPVGEYIDNHVSLIPDFIANCGMARVFALLMSQDEDPTIAGIFEDASQVIRQAVESVHNVSSEKTCIAARALELALKKLV